MSYSSSYNLVDRGLHRAAFCTPLVQRALSELENDLFRRELAGVESTREVFITGLPRAGTTLLLELLYATGEFRTYTYRDMPFVLAPLLWRSVSRLFRKPAVESDRAHEDGMKIGFDSPEAFEEVVWMTYLADAIVRGDTLATLSIDDVTDESVAAIRASVRKVLAPSRGAGRVRYLSKNNANIARLDVLTKLFPEATVVVVFREPYAHVASLARQHRLFTKKHAEDEFARQYMRWLGHFEFGANFKPIDFDGWIGAEGVPADVDATFWLRYWTAAYRYALDHRTEAIRFVDFDKLLQLREQGLRSLAASLVVECEAALVAGAAGLRSPTTRAEDDRAYPPEARSRAQSVYAELRTLAI